MDTEKYLFSRECEVYVKSCDVIVIGGGTAGIAAAVSAAIEGMSCLILEENTFLGGAAPSQQVLPMMTLRLPGDRFRDSSPLNIRIKKEMKERNAAFDTGSNDGWFNVEMLKYQHEDMALSEKIDVLYGARFIGSSVKNGHIENVIVSCRGKLLAVKGKAFIDCTGDALVAADAGAECVCGGLGGKRQALSLRFMVGNADLLRLKVFLKSIGEPSCTLNYPIIAMSSVIGAPDTPLWKLMERAEAEKVLTNDDRKYFQAFSVPAMPGVMSFNCPEIPDEYDANDPEQYTQAIIWGRKAVLRLHEFLKRYLCGFEESCILSVAQLGIRESRRIKGKYYLSGEEYHGKVKFDDAIARTNYPIDIHSSGSVQAGSGTDGIPGEEEYTEIPFGCLVTKRLDNLFVAGRCISADFDAQAGLRIQPTCHGTGEAAGIGAAFCVKDKTSAYDIDGIEVRRLMKQRGAFL